jgi:photosystem II stability/assembly factor-like uncharacterized protein
VDGWLVSIGEDVAWVSVAVYPQERNGPDPVVVTVYQTVDGGEHWSPGTPFELEHGIAEAPMFIDRLHGWIFPWLGEGGNNEARQLWRTVDGGRTWKLVASPGDSEGVPLSCSKSGLAFVDESAGWMTGYCPGPFFLYETTDGGATWIPRRSLPVPEGLPPEAFDLAVDLGSYGPVFFPDRAGSFVVRLVFLDGPIYHLLYATQDGGETWIPYLLPNGTIGDPEFITPEQGWVSDGRQLHATINGGADWDYVGILPAASSPSHDVHMDFVNPQLGWLLDGDALLSTEDGGHTWQYLEPLLASAP